MVINNATTTISFFPFVSFGIVVGTVSVEVWHKNTKTMVSGNSNVTIVGSKVTLNLPSLTTIADVAENLDTVLIRVKEDGVLMWEYVATWSDESTNINNTFKDWNTTADEQPQWITI